MSTAREWKSRVVRGSLWVVVVAEVIALGGAGAAKFLSAGVWSAWFSAWGYPAGFSYLVGVVEVAGALLLVPKRSASYAAGALIVVMLGALLTVLRHPGQLGPTAPVVHCVALACIAALRWRARWRYASLRSKGGSSPAT